MAGYIEWSKGLAEKREVLVMASRLKRDPNEIAGRLMRFWEWCDDNVPEEAIDKETGDAVIFLSPSRGDTEAFIDGKCGINGIAKCLASDGVEWHKYERTGRLRMVNFGRHNGSTAKTRSRNARNQAKRREKAVTDVSPFSSDKKVTTQPNPTQPNNGRVGRSVEDSLEGVQGESASFGIACLQKLEARHLDRISDLCAIHRALHAESPEMVGCDEDALLAVIGAADRTIRKAKSSRTEFFRGIFRRGKFPTITAQEKSDALHKLQAYRKLLSDSIENGVEIPERNIPLCDTKARDQ